MQFLKEGKKHVTKEILENNKELVPVLTGLIQVKLFYENLTKIQTKEEILNFLKT